MRPARLRAEKDPKGINEPGLMRSSTIFTSPSAEIGGLGAGDEPLPQQILWPKTDEQAARNACFTSACLTVPQVECPLCRRLGDRT